MKISKEGLKKGIENIIGNGVAECEEIDTTTIKLLKMIWPVIQYQADQIDKLKSASPTSVDE